MTLSTYVNVIPLVYSFGMPFMGKFRGILVIDHRFDLMHMDQNVVNSTIIIYYLLSIK